MGSPIYNPPVPFTGPIPGGFMPGRMVRVQGRVNSSGNYFSINLLTGPNTSYDDIALHVNPRLSENVIVRNAKASSSWGPEERHGPPMSIFRDQSFEILILSEPSIFKIAVNGQHFTEFTHRVPVERVSYIQIDGDLTISLIQFDGTAQPSYSASAPPMGYAPPPPVGGGACPYPPASNLPTPGFTMPVAAGMGAAAATAPYPSAGAPAYPPPPQHPYGGYPPSSGPSAGGYYPQPQAGYPTPGQPQPGYYQPQGPPHHGSGSSGGGMLSDASKLLAGGLAGVGLAKVANKIPGMGGGHGHHGGYPHGGGHHGGGGGGIMGTAAGLLGPAAAMGLAGKGMKKGKKNKLLKYGVPIGGAVVGGYALKKGMKGFKGGSSSSSSSSSEEE